VTELTDEEKNILEKMKEERRRHPLKPLVTPNPDKFTDGILIPADQVKDWHEIADKGQRRAPKHQGRGKRKTEPK
jgi:hypothetical protein